jgi:hypothetical protein
VPTNRHAEIEPHQILQNQSTLHSAERRKDQYGRLYRGPEQHVEENEDSDEYYR